MCQRAPCWPTPLRALVFLLGPKEREKGLGHGMQRTWGGDHRHGTRVFFKFGDPEVRWGGGLRAQSPPPGGSGRVGTSRFSSLFNTKRRKKILEPQSSPHEVPMWVPPSPGLGPPARGWVEFLSELSFVPGSGIKIPLQDSEAQNQNKTPEKATNTQFLNLNCVERLTGKQIKVFESMFL